MADKDKKKTEAPEELEANAAAEADASEDEATDEEEFSFVEDPSFEVEYKGDCAYEVGVSIPPANLADQANKMFDELKNEAEVPGFRPGRAPRKLIERKFAKVVRGEVESKLVSQAFHKLVKDEDLKPINMPDVDGIDEAKERKDDEPFAFTLKFEVAPRIELGKYRGIEVEKPILKVNDKDIESAIEEMRGRYSTFETLAKGKAKDGDQLIIDFKGTVDGDEFPGGTAQSYPYILGTKRFFPEFEKALKGTTAGKEVTCTVTLPEDNPNEDLRGKEAEFTITVNEIKRRTMPELTDEFAKQAGYENVDDLRTKLGERLRDAASGQSDSIAEAQALSAVLEASTYEIPKSMIEGVAEDLYQDEVRRMLSMRVPIAQISEHDSELRERSQDGAVNEIKRLVTLNEIAEAEGIEVTEDDFEQEVQAIASRTGAAMEAVASYLEEGDRRGSYEARLMRSKAMKAIMDAAKVTEKEVSREELAEGDNSEEGSDA